MEKLNLLFIIITIISISTIFGTFCGYNPPEDSHYCGNYLGQNNISRCCFCTHNITGTNSCLIVFNGTKPDEYTCNCDDVEENDDLPGSPCLNHTQTIKLGNNITKEYCHGLSKDEKHPCCYYNDGLQKRCFSIGKITTTTLYTYNNEFINCFSTYHKINYFFILFLILQLI